MRRQKTAAPYARCYVEARDWNVGGLRTHSLSYKIKPTRGKEHEDNFSKTVKGLMEKRYEANDLRKKGEIDKALGFYRELLGDGDDPYVVAGLIYCLRKKGDFAKAADVSARFASKHQNIPWCKREAIWALIKGKLDKLGDGASIEQICAVAEEIYGFSPIDINSKWYVIKRVLKSARADRRWDIIQTWVDKIDPEQLSAVPMKDENGREGWSDQAIWHNFQIRSMLEVGDKNQAGLLARAACARFPRQQKYFARLEALVAFRLARLLEAEKLYCEICSKGKPDWWMLHEYAETLKELGKKKDALREMCRAAASHHKLESLVTIFHHIGLLCKDNGDLTMACNHFLLYKFVRTKNGWSIPSEVEKTISEIALSEEAPSSLKDALSICRNFWLTMAGPQSKLSSPPTSRKSREALTGRLNLGPQDRAFCFITDQSGQDYFCLKDELPENISHGAVLVFDAIPAYDRKKGRESWKATNIRKAADS